MATIYEIPSLLALIFKLVLLAYAAKSPVKNSLTRIYLILLVLMFCFDFVEFTGLTLYKLYGFDIDLANLFGVSHFIFLIAFIAVMLHISLLLGLDAEALRGRERYLFLLYLPVIFLEYLLLFTDELVIGFKPYLYTILCNPGPLYFLFETYAVLYLVAALVNLIYGARRTRFPVISRTRNRLWLLALAPSTLLLSYLIIANHFGWTRLASTFYFPITLTFFLVITTYATHRYRLFEIEFYIPWSKVRKRKTAFYGRIQAIIAEIADLRSVREILQLLANTLRCPVALVGGPRPMVAAIEGPQPAVATAREALTLAEFPREALEKIDRIVIAHEIAEAMPQTYALMKRHGAAAIVPFHPHSGAAANWMLLGEQFSEQVYTPLDFKVVEALFDRIAERFLDKLLLLRSQLAEAYQDLRDYHRRLAVAWADKEANRKALAAVETEIRELRARNAVLLRERFTLIETDRPAPIVTPEKTLDEYLVEYEANIIKQTLAYCDGNRSEAAQLLGLRPNTLHYKMKRLGLVDDKKGH
ncbi:MAG TPA: helix-turn-helix domain-containing protein [Acidiferrobacterales bacterium]|nr:helix-turn-helix domain-containing protein [Acidiferrobacterales bacterium]